MMATRQGNILERIENVFVVKQTRLAYDPQTKLCFSEEVYHSQLTVFIGIAQNECEQMIVNWLKFFNDEDLIDMGIGEVIALFDQQKLLEVPVSDDGNMN